MSADLTRSNILERLRTVVPDKIDIDPTLMVPEARLEDIGLDSFTLIELVFLAEEEFHIRIPLDDLRPVTVNDVIEIIVQRAASS